MFETTNGFVNILLSVVLFPLHFQVPFLQFAWGMSDPTWLMLLKRIFLLLPVSAVILGSWLTVGSMLTVIFRQSRRQFITTLIITWWDLGKATVAFWGGIINFIFRFFVALSGLLRITILGIWSLIQEIIFMPFRLVGRVFGAVGRSSIPWIALILTLFWCLIEAMIFTYVTTPLVIDTFSNITGEQFAENLIRIPLFIFLFFIVLGSYSVLSTFVEAMKRKDITSIIGIGVIEIIVLFVEVVFLYREFVDALVPWFAQYSENFELGIFWTLAISCFAWFGIRSLSWFLFAAHGTPMLMKIIQGKQTGAHVPAAEKAKPRTLFSNGYMDSLKENNAWIQAKGEELLEALMLPPLQVIAAAINFCILLISGQHLFEIPLRNFAEVTDSKHLIEKIFGDRRKQMNGVYAVKENV
jgi:hypothetical protein